jgi:hypothetical protein
MTLSRSNEGVLAAGSSTRVGRDRLRKRPRSSFSLKVLVKDDSVNGRFILIRTRPNLALINLDRLLAVYLPTSLDMCFLLY